MSRRKNKKRKQIATEEDVTLERHSSRNQNCHGYTFIEDWKQNCCFYLNCVKNAVLPQLDRIYCYIGEFIRKHFYSLMFNVFMLLVIFKQQTQIDDLINSNINQGRQLVFSNERFGIFSETTEKRHVMLEKELISLKEWIQNVDIESNENLKKLTKQNERLYERFVLFEIGLNVTFAQQQNINRRFQNKILENENGIETLGTKFHNLDEFMKQEFQKFDLIETERVKFMEKIAIEMENLNQDTIQQNMHTNDLHEKLHLLSVQVDTVKKDIKDKHYNHREYQVEKRSLVPDVQKMVATVVIKAANYVVSTVINAVSSGLAAVGSWVAGFLW